MDQLIVNSESTLQDAIAKLRENFEKDRYVHVKMNSNKRTLTQDALAHVWYGQIADYEGNKAEDIKSYCKYNFGMQMLGQDPDCTEYINMVRDKIKPMAYEERIKFMKYIRVTSLMDTASHAAYMKKLQLFYGTQGIELKNKKDQS